MQPMETTDEGPDSEPASGEEKVGPDWYKIKKFIITGLLDGGMSERSANEIMLEYDSTFDCQFRSDTWRNCQYETGRGKKCKDDFEWCRPCLAKKKLKRSNRITNITTYRKILQ